jgi:L-fucose mutarotase
MLMNIHRLITPEIFEAIYRMGHLDELVIADANYSAVEASQRVVYSSADQNHVLLKHILQYFPIEEDDEDAINVMLPDRGYRQIPEPWRDFEQVLLDEQYNSRILLNKLERGAFYERVRRAYVTIQTNDPRLFADIIIRKGVVMV